MTLAKKWFTAAAEQGYEHAIENLKVLQSEDTALKLFLTRINKAVLKADASDDASSSSVVVFFKDDGEDDANNDNEQPTIDIIIDDADEASLRLRVCENGETQCDTPPQQPKKRKKKTAAEANDDNVIAVVPTMEGLLAKQRTMDGEKYFEEAQSSLKKDSNYGTLFDLMLKSANHEHVEAMYIVATMYASGQGCERSNKDSQYWAGKAAANGHAMAIHNTLPQLLTTTTTTEYSNNVKLESKEQEETKEEEMKNDHDESSSDSEYDDCDITTSNQPGTFFSINYGSDQTLLLCHDDRFGFIAEAAAKVQKRANFQALVRATKNNQADLVRDILDLDNTIINNTKKEGESSLMIAVKRGHYEVVEVLMEWGADVVHLNEDGWSALLIGCETGNSQIVALLLNNYGTNVNQRNTEGVFPLYMACEKNHKDIVKLLLGSIDIDINMKFRDKYTPLMKAEEEGFDEIVDMLKKHVLL